MTIIMNCPSRTGTLQMASTAEKFKNYKNAWLEL
jgi:hypothetical protein